MKKALVTMAACGVLVAYAAAPQAWADPADDARAEQFCGYLRMNGYTIGDCGWMSLVAKGQCAGLMSGRTYKEMMHTSEVMAGAETESAQWAVLKTAVNVYCPILDGLLPMSP